MPLRIHFKLLQWKGTHPNVLFGQASKIRRRCGEVFRYAVITGRVKYNPAPDLAGAMNKPETKHFPFLSENEIPKERMKKRRPHLVPLSPQVLEILGKLQVITGSYPILFPGRNDARKSISEASINKVIAKIGYKGKLTGHGFRHMMSTILHEKGFDSAWIELQLAHVDKNSIRGIYNHAQHIQNRNLMLKWYADKLYPAIKDI